MESGSEETELNAQKNPFNEDLLTQKAKTFLKS
jgi:hypothetical protein